MIKRFIKFLVENKILLLVIIVAALLRFIGTNPGYNKFHSDEGISYSAAVSMIKNNNLDPLRYDYPSIVPLSNYIFFKYLFIPIKWTEFYISHLSQIVDGIIKVPVSGGEYRRIFQLEILGEREINALFWGRYVTALFSLGNVVLVYFFGKKLFSRRVGLLAAFFLAVNFKAVVNSHIGLPDTYNAFFLLLSLISSYQLITRKNVKNYLIAGVCLGLSFSIKYQVFAVFPLAVALFFSALGNKKGKSFFNINNFYFWKILLLGIVAVVVFIILNPYVFIHFEEAREVILFVSKKYAMGRSKLMLYPFYYFINIDYGLPLFILAFGGIFYLILKHFKQAIFILGELAPFFFITVYYSIGGFYIRNFITITPPLMVVAAASVDYFYTMVKKTIKQRNNFGVWVLMTFVVFAVVFVPLRNSIINSYYYTKPWSYDQILIKSAKLLPENSLVASHPFDPLPGNVRRIYFESATLYSLSEFRQDKADYALINMDWASNNFYGWMTEILPKSAGYYRKPIEEMRNNYWGLSIEEMMNYVQVSSYKPWQAPDAALFLLKVPYFKDVNYSAPVKLKIKDWTGDFLILDNIGGVVVKANHIYKITALVRSDEDIQKDKRNVFVRVDFYDSLQTSADKKGIFTSVSPRYFGHGWQKLEIIAVAPKKTESAGISLQSSGSLPNSYLLKNVSIEESVLPAKSEENYEIIKFDQYKDLLYPNSHGNL